MKKLAPLFLVLGICAIVFGALPVSAGTEIICASTTSTENSGLFDYLLPLFEKKTGKQRRITINNAVYLALAPLLTSLKDSPPTDPLFQSEKTGSCLTVPTLSTLVKTWCRRAKIQKGKFSGHSMRKAFGYFQRQVFGTPTYILSEMFNHSSEKITLKYLGIQPEEIKTAYMREI